MSPIGERIRRKAARSYRDSRVALTDALALRTSRRVDIGSIKSVCVALGPYRNLTTLTAVTLFLHPQCRVLNHGAKRIYGKSEIDFLQQFTPAKLDRFCQFATLISKAGHRGHTGGSVTRSHAVADNERARMFLERAEAAGKAQATSLFWKESLRTSNKIRERGVDLGSMFASDTRPRFLLPIRHPIDCALSNLKTGHVGHFGISKTSPPHEVIRVILDEIFWFAGLQQQFPARFHHFYEYDISRDMLVALARFLELEPHEEWIDNALAAMRINPGYEHDDSLVRFFSDYLDTHSERAPAMAEGLRGFLPS